MQTVALALAARRELLLRVHRHRLRREDLEDCYGQTAVELLAHARRGGRFASTRMLEAAIERRFLSRVADRRRALGGRSPMQAALEEAKALDGHAGGAIEIADPRCDPERVAMARHELRWLAGRLAQLTPDQRLALVSQALGIPAWEVCAEYGWSIEKYRKVAQRGRARLGALVSGEASGVPSAVGASDQ